MSNIVGGVHAELLKQYIEQIERLELEKVEVLTNIKEAFAAAKSAGLEPKIMKQVIKMRKMEQKELDEQDMLLTTYQRALGMLPSLDD
jgi:uncharacterized protein (UPF0335 family)